MENILGNILGKFRTLIPTPESFQNRGKERMEERKKDIFNDNKF